jgi:tRNA-modifying protein YgfZ
MQYRTITRKRVVPLAGEAALPESGTPVVADGVEIGKLGSVEDGRALALLRLDRAAEFGEKGVQLLAGTVPVEIKLPSWANFSLKPEKPPTKLKQPSTSA